MEEECSSVACCRAMVDNLGKQVVTEGVVDVVKVQGRPTNPLAVGTRTEVGCIGLARKNSSAALGSATGLELVAGSMHSSSQAEMSQAKRGSAAGRQLA